MSKDQAEEPSLWYRCRTELTGSVSIPGVKKPKPEAQGVLVIKGEKCELENEDEKNSEAVKAKSGKPVAKKKNEKKAKNKADQTNGEAAPQRPKNGGTENNINPTIVLLDDEVTTKDPTPPQSPPVSQVALPIEKSSKLQESKKNVPEEQKNTAKDFPFKCPDPKCSEGFSDHLNLILHIKNSHSLQCQMPYCSYTCFSFQEYCEHFEKVHCVSIALPQKRGPRIASKEPDPQKQLKSNI